MTKEKLQAKKDLRCVYRTLHLLKDIIKNAPERFDCEENELFEVSLCVVSRMQLIRIAKALRALIDDDEPSTR